MLSSGSKKSGVTRLLTQERGGEAREFQIQVPTENTVPPASESEPQPQNSPASESAPQPQNPPASESAPQPQNSPASESAPQPQNPPASESAPQPQNKPPQQQTPNTETPVPIPFGNQGGTVELTADSQEYDSERQTILAEGNVVMRFQQAVLNADKLQVNLPNRIAIAEGNVMLTRGQQVLRGNRFEYYFAQDSGVIFNASGEFYQPTAGADLSPSLPNDVGAATVPSQPLSDRIAANQPLEQVTSEGGFGIGIGARRNIPNQPRLQQGGTINRLRFSAEQVNFDGDGLLATNVRITNDPFSPPEFELRTDSAQFRRLSSLQSEVVTSRPRIVLDQGLEVPLFRNRIGIDQRPTEASPINFGIDNSERGGLFVGANFEPINTPAVRLRVTPQFFLQRAVEEGKYFDPDAFGVRARLNATLSPTTTLRGSGVLTSLDLNNIENELRASLRLQQTIGINRPHTLSLEYSYRDRLFNGSLGYQTVRSSLGAVLTSPVINLGQTGVSLSYQAGAQLINAETDRLDLLEANRENNRISLSRYQASASLNRGFLLWQGKGLPATPTEGLRYTPVPVVPYLRLNAGVTGVGTGYSSGDSQNSISGNIGLQGQFGHFSRPFLDYTGFNITYSQIFPGGESPFLFDRIVDTRVLSAGINQQIYGPFRLGIQTSISLDNDEQISTDYFLEYSRRTYNILLRYNPVLELGSISFRINGFNWEGNADPLSSSDVRPVVQGVPR
ncbi:MAG: DUF3769 domain-containing protein [Aphanothece sp. CMT-3BRIN-NPC111]|nr:DUF3769 domain-containing protein [Aphanothece sp. CMT-3BRIN-NPC111]